MGPKTVQNQNKIKEVWAQKRIPVVYRKGKEYPLLLRLPYNKDNRAWIKDDKRHNPK
jgi:hypothetical protein